MTARGASQRTYRPRERSTDALESASISPATATARSAAAHADAPRQDDPIHPARGRVLLGHARSAGAISSPPGSAQIARMRSAPFSIEPSKRGQRVAAKQQADVPAEAAQVRQTIDLPAVVEANATRTRARSQMSGSSGPRRRTLPSGAGCLRSAKPRGARRCRRAHHLHLLDSALGEERLRDPRTPGGIEHRPGSRLRRARGGRRPRRARAAPSAGTPRRAPRRSAVAGGRAAAPRVRQRALGRHAACRAARPLTTTSQRVCSTSSAIFGAPACLASRSSRAARRARGRRDRRRRQDRARGPRRAPSRPRPRATRRSLGVRPPRCLDRGKLRPVPRERVRRQEAAFLREVLEGVAGEEVPVDVSFAIPSTRASALEVGVRAERVEVRLDAAEPRERMDSSARR